MSTKTDRADYRYGSINGEVVCARHIGCEGEGWLRENPEVRRFTTSMTTWHRLSQREIATFSEITGGETCMRCLWGN